MLYPPANAVSVLCHQSLNKMKSIHAIFAEMKSENWSQSPAKAQAKLANSYVTADALPSQAASSQQLGDHDSRCWAQAEHLAHEAAACKEVATPVVQQQRPRLHAMSFQLSMFLSL